MINMTWFMFYENRSVQHAPQAQIWYLQKEYFAERQRKFDLILDNDRNFYWQVVFFRRILSDDNLK